MFAFGISIYRWLTTSGGAEPPPVTNRIIAENGDLITAENGDYIEWE